MPDKYHLCLEFEDGSFFSATTQMWGTMVLHESGKEWERKYIKGMAPAPDDPLFTMSYFSGLIDTLLGGKKRSVKGLLTQDQLIPGLGNAISQDNLFRATLHPRDPIDDLSRVRRRKMYDAIQRTVREAIKEGGRNDEYDLYGKPGKYVRLMDNRSVGQPCTQCGGKIETMHHLGGACCFCPRCQK